MHINRHPHRRPAPLCLCFALALLAVLPALHSAVAAEIAILKSADISYYDEAIQGFRTMIPPQATVKEYNLEGSLSNGREIARMLRADPPALVFAVVTLHHHFARTAAHRAEAHDAHRPRYHRVHLSHRVDGLIRPVAGAAGC